MAYHDPRFDGGLDDPRRYQEDPMKQTSPESKLYPCPTCGTSDRWVAHYMVPESQGVTLVEDPDGKEDGSTPLATDYDGASHNRFDAEEDDFYECLACGTTVTPSGDVKDHAAAATYVAGQKENNP